MSGVKHKNNEAHLDDLRTSRATPNAPEFFHNLFFLGLISFNEFHLLLQNSLFDSIGSGHSRLS